MTKQHFDKSTFLLKNKITKILFYFKAFSIEPSHLGKNISCKAFLFKADWLLI